METRTDKILVENLVKLKKEYGVTYTHLAKQVGISSSIIYSLIKGNPFSLSQEKKEKLMDIMDTYLKGEQQ